MVFITNCKAHRPCLSWLVVRIGYPPILEINKAFYCLLCLTQRGNRAHAEATHPSAAFSLFPHVAAEPAPASSCYVDCGFNRTTFTSIHLNRKPLSPRPMNLFNLIQTFAFKSLFQFQQILATSNVINTIGHRTQIVGSAEACCRRGCECWVYGVVCDSPVFKEFLPP